MVRRKTPRGDYNADGFVNDEDQTAMYETIKKTTPLTRNEIQTFDLNEDGKVTHSDIIYFCAIYDAFNPETSCELIDKIPAISTWGTVTTGLLLLTAGTILANRRRTSSSLPGFVRIPTRER
ncbi:MAG: hypothetical protein IID35_12070 [Planctomycetes bacterium]|nr:hypothetical protein [Planctomycetota bacterium]